MKINFVMTHKPAVNTVKILLWKLLQKFQNHCKRREGWAGSSCSCTFIAVPRPWGGLCVRLHTQLLLVLVIVVGAHLARILSGLCQDCASIISGYVSYKWQTCHVFMSWSNLCCTSIKVKSNPLSMVCCVWILARPIFNCHWTALS